MNWADQKMMPARDQSFRWVGLLVAFIACL
jgi:hypothetical protein